MGSTTQAANVTDDDAQVTAKIARAHLNEFPDYYTRLERMEGEDEARLEGAGRLKPRPIRLAPVRLMGGRRLQAAPGGRREGLDLDTELA